MIIFTPTMIMIGLTMKMITSNTIIVAKNKIKLLSKKMAKNDQLFVKTDHL